MSAHNRIAEIKNNGYYIDFGDIFNRSFENYKKIALTAGLVFILLGFVFMALMVGIMGIFWGFSTFSEEMAGLNIENIPAYAIVIYVIAVVVISGIVAPINAGIIKMAYNAANNLDFSIGTAFEYYKTSYFTELFTATALISFLSVVINTAIEMAGIPLLGALFSYVIAFFTFLTIPLIIFGNLKAVEAIKASVMIVSKQFLILLGLLLVSVIMAGLGIFGFCIGIFFTVPFIFSVYYCVYDEVVGAGHKSELDEIGSSVE